jgi:arylsulfatase
MVGKWHLCPTDEMNLAATRRNLAERPRFERWYGFLGAETNQWYPDLVSRQPPGRPAEGHRRTDTHLTDDITDKGSRVHQGREGDRA